ncbi:MAG: hypothetical protein QOD06_2119 [Candidatus Binatota bacterium]|jgi:hypothetical protein|nr:hypothetical protein [Candidatus Binatota bacterium]
MTTSSAPEEPAPLAAEIFFPAEDKFAVRLVDGRELFVPLSWFPRLAQATSKERANWRLIGGGVGIHWPELDEDVSVARLLGFPTD